MNEENAGVETDELGSELEEGVETVAEVSSAEEEDDTDWKTIAENYKTALTQKRQLRTTPTPVIEENEDEDRPVTLKDLKVFQQNTVAIVSESKEDILLAQKIPDPAKRAYVKQLLESRIVRTGTSDSDIANDIEDALSMADRKRTEKTISELKRVAANRPQAPAAGSSSEKPLEKKAYAWTAAEAQALETKAKQLNLDPEKFKKDAWANKKTTRAM